MCPKVSSQHLCPSPLLVPTSVRVKTSVLNVAHRAPHNLTLNSGLICCSSLPYLYYSSHSGLFCSCICTFAPSISFIWSTFSHVSTLLTSLHHLCLCSHATFLEKLSLAISFQTCSHPHHVLSIFSALSFFITLITMHYRFSYFIYILSLLTECKFTRNRDFFFLYAAISLVFRIVPDM